MYTANVSADRLSAEMSGTRGDLLRLVLKTTALTVGTLGLYSFWARTRIRRWLWSSLRVGGMPFEYAGRPLEKLMGFAIAAVIVAIYLGLVVMLLVFASLNLFGEVWQGTAAAFAFVVPVYWFAKYRGQRYLLNHTRWRGVAFSMEPGAWGYVACAAWWSLLTILTAGLLLPVRTQRMWRYRTRRTFYGDGRFALATSAARLYRSFLPVLICLWGIAACAVWASLDGGILPGLAIALLGGGLVPVWTYWRVSSFRLLVSGLRHAEGVGVTVVPRTATVIGIHLYGWLLMGLLLILAGIAVAFAFGFAAAGMQSGIDFDLFADTSPYLIAFGAVLFYLTFFVLRGALKIAMVTFPLFRHVAATLSVSNSLRIHYIAQGEPAHMADADGFANLFDLGSGI